MKYTFKIIFTVVPNYFTKISKSILYPMIILSQSLDFQLMETGIGAGVWGTPST